MSSVLAVSHRNRIKTTWTRALPDRPCSAKCHQRMPACERYANQHAWQINTLCKHKILASPAYLRVGQRRCPQLGHQVGQHRHESTVQAGQRACTLKIDATMSGLHVRRGGMVCHDVPLSVCAIAPTPKFQPQPCISTAKAASHPPVSLSPSPRRARADFWLAASHTCKGVEARTEQNM